MRILCLHGSALHGQLFEAKTAKLRSLLPQTYSYEWLDGQYHVVPPKLIRDAYPGPYLSHIESLTTDGMKSAMARLETIIEERGPFDGVMGISEVSHLSRKKLTETDAVPEGCHACRLAADQVSNGQADVDSEIRHFLRRLDSLDVDRLHRPGRPCPHEEIPSPPRQGRLATAKHDTMSRSSPSTWGRGRLGSRIQGVFKATLSSSRYAL